MIVSNILVIPERVMKGHDILFTLENIGSVLLRSIMRVKTLLNIQILLIHNITENLQPFTYIKLRVKTLKNWLCLSKL